SLDTPVSSAGQAYQVRHDNMRRHSGEPWTPIRGKGEMKLVVSKGSLQRSARNSLLNQSTNLVLNCFTQRTQ
ncbi:MAG: hypothetical protein V3S76_02165, partial [Candidatus Bipolaricaulota bacterium]